MSYVFHIFWIFIMIAALTPVIQRHMLEAGRLRFLKKLERKRKSRFIALIHRQETMKLLGFPIMRYIDIEDSEELMRAIHLTDEDVPIDLILHTPGGQAKDEIDDETYIMADIARKSINQIKYCVKDILLEKMDEAKAEEVADILTRGEWTHDYPITAEHAQQIGLPVSTDVPEQIYQYMNLFPQSEHRRPSVQYVPAPYRGREDRKV
jgi:ClpP class serine protease